MPLALNQFGQSLGGALRGCQNLCQRVLVSPVQMVVVVDAELASQVLGNGEGLCKALEPDLSDKLMSHSGHRTMFSADTNSPYWRLIRKGAAPAFISKNIKCSS